MITGTRVKVDVSPRGRRYLHMLGAIVAVFAVLVLGIIALASAGRNVIALAGSIAGIAVLVAYILYAHRRTNALLKEEADLSREQADRAFEQLKASQALTTAVSLRWRARTHVAAIVLVIATAGGAALGWAKGLWLLLVLSGLGFILLVKTLLGRFAEPVVLRIGPTGIEDLGRFGLIPWQDIERVSLHEYEMKGTRAASLSIGVRDPVAYSRRVGALARFWLRAETLGIGDEIQFQLQALDMAPPAVFRVVRAFHERVLPDGALSGTDNFYQVDIEGAKLNELMAELENSVAASPASAAPGRRHEELMARMDALVKADTEKMSRTLARARKTSRAGTILTISVALLFAAWVAAKIFG